MLWSEYIYYCHKTKAYIYYQFPACFFRVWLPELTHALPPLYPASSSYFYMIAQSKAGDIPSNFSFLLSAGFASGGPNH
jgi:hypothetical protein